jgi:hypothetical protein
MTRSVPIDGECVDAQILRLTDLALNHGRVIAGVFDTNVVGIAKPGLKRRDDFGAFVGVGQFMERTVARAVIARPGHKTCPNNRTQK